jgi:hypothetical protein
MVRVKADVLFVEVAAATRKPMKENFMFGAD